MRAKPHRQSATRVSSSVMLCDLDGVAATGPDGQAVAGRPADRSRPRARGTRPRAQGRARRRRRGLGCVWRSRRREDRAARVDHRGGAGVPSSTHGRRRGGDGAPVRGASTAVLADPRSVASSARSPARCACRRIRTDWEPRARRSESVPGRAGGPRTLVGGRRGASRSCVLSTTRSGSTVRRRARSRSWPAACWRRRSPWSSRRASRATRSRDCRSFTSCRWGIVMRGRCWSRSCRPAG